MAEKNAFIEMGEAKKYLREVSWKEGEVFHIVEGPYRHRIVVFCSSAGRQKAGFANGEHSYFSFVQIVNGNGQWIKSGAAIVPVLPDGRFIMVVEQRPAQSYYSDSTVAMIGGKKQNLDQFGSYSSLEFPGGAIDPGERLRGGFLRELKEETGVKEQEALCYIRRSLCPFGSDLAISQSIIVAFLSGFSHDNFVETDGGLNVFALTEEEVVDNIHRGVICSGQAALLQWGFFEQVKRARQQMSLEDILVEKGFFKIETLKIA